METFKVIRTKLFVESLLFSVVVGAEPSFAERTHRQTGMVANKTYGQQAAGRLSCRQ